jgi:2-octaprenyl-3-methyl-6-methoxy-1,4-benzoquinol hydroxylase
MLPQQEISWQRFTPSGPQAFLPLPGHHASLVWYHRPAEVKRLLALDDGDFMSELEATFPECLGGVSGITARGSFPLRRMHAHRYVDRRVALVGDAAHTVHPLAGQGVNLGMLDAAVLAEVLLTALGRAEDLGDGEVLARYERRRRRDILAMMGVIDIFYRLFGNDVVPVKLLRNLGLEVANRLTPAKRQVMRFALGLTGEAPMLVRSPDLSS